MTTFEGWSLVFQGLACSAAAGGVPLLLRQLRQNQLNFKEQSRRTRDALEADHDRRKKQATIDHCAQVRTEWRALRLKLRTKLGKGPLDDAKLQVLNSNPDLEEAALALLSSMEVFSAGANAEVFDVDLIGNVCGGYLIGVFEDLERVIIDQRRVHSNPSSYAEFERLVGAMRDKRRLAPVQPVRPITP